jgi:hypothetical protein
VSEALARVPALVPDVVVLEVAPSEIAEFTVAVCAGTVTGRRSRSRGLSRGRCSPIRPRWRCSGLRASRRGGSWRCWLIGTCTTMSSGRGRFRSTRSGSWQPAGIAAGVQDPPQPPVPAMTRAPSRDRGLLCRHQHRGALGARPTDRRGQCRSHDARTAERPVLPGLSTSGHVLVGHFMRQAIGTAGDRDRVPPISHGRHPATAVSSRSGW